MNVKQGDLAIIIKSLAGNEGQIVSVVRPIIGRHIRNDYNLIGPFWQVTKPGKILNVAGKMVIYGAIPDAWLRPVSGLPEINKIDSEVAA
jgi:hypothetical protein